MDSEEVFALHGPKHMMARIGSSTSPTVMVKINWEKPEHRRCITACIVRGVYIMEMDREKGWTQMLAPAWWKSFHFQCTEILQDHDGFIYGAIFVYAPPDGAWRHSSAPRYVVAFRGTMRRHSTFSTDMDHNIEMALNDHHKFGRYSDARRSVGELLNGVAYGHIPPHAVWLAGHSLGASIALDVGRHVMDERQWRLPTFLFNPPHVSASPVINRLGVAEEKKTELYFTSFIVKTALAKTVGRSHEKRMRDLFERLAPWVPELYVHEDDPVCQGYIDYFEQRQKMLDKSGLSRWVGEVGMKISYRDMWTSSHDNYNNPGNGDELRVQPHLLPSAMLWKNSGVRYPAHGLQQWWQPDSKLNLRYRPPYIYHGP